MDEKQERVAQFRDLVAGIGQLCGIEVPGVSGATDSPIWVNVDIDGVPLVLTYSPLTDGGQFTLEGRLCLPEPDRELDLLRWALEVNLMLSRNGCMTVGRHPLTQALVLVACLPLDRVTPESLLVSMMLMAEQCAAWASGRVLDEALSGAGEVEATSGANQPGQEAGKAGMAKELHELLNSQASGLRVE